MSSQISSEVLLPRPHRRWVLPGAQALILLLVLSACSDASEPDAMVVPPSVVVDPVPSPSTVADQTTVVPASTAPPVTVTVAGARMVDTKGMFGLAADPIVPFGDKVAWNSWATGPGAVVFHEGSAHLFTYGSKFGPVDSAVGYWRSDDGGATWVEPVTGPVLDGSVVDYSTSGGIIPGSVLVEDDGTWVLYFSTWDGAGVVAPSRIGRATAVAPEGPWVADDELVLTDTDGSWDGYAVFSPSVIKVDDWYVMYYTGLEGDVSAVGRATSSDGVSWVKDPAPLLLDPADGWTKQNLSQSTVIKTDEGWVMAYLSSQDSLKLLGSQWVGGLAVSEDGLTWVQAEAPLLTASAAGGTGVWGIDIAWSEGTYYVFAEISIPPNPDYENLPSQVHLYTYQGTLLDK